MTAHSALFSAQRMLDAEPNPCVSVYGYGPDGATCKTCGHLLGRQYSPHKRFYKCYLRHITSGAATDHRVGWKACGRYEVAK